MWSLCWHLYFDNLWLIPSPRPCLLVVMLSEEWGGRGGCFNPHYLLSLSDPGPPREMELHSTVCSSWVSSGINLDIRLPRIFHNLYLVKTSQMNVTHLALWANFTAPTPLNLAAQPHFDRICQIRSLLYWARCNGPMAGQHPCKGGLIVRLLWHWTVLRQWQHRVMSGT